MRARPFRMSDTQAERSHAGHGWSHGENQATNPTTRAESLGERPRPRLAAREDHAGGIRRLRVAGVRADVPHGQEDPERDGHAPALRLPQLPPARAIPALRGGGRGRGVRVLAGQVLGNARLPVRKPGCDGRTSARPGAPRRPAWTSFGSGARCAPTSTPRRSGASGREASAAESRRRRPSSSTPSGTRAPSAWRPCSRHSRPPRVMSRIGLKTRSLRIASHEESAKAHRRFPC